MADPVCKPGILDFASEMFLEQVDKVRRTMLDDGWKTSVVGKGIRKGATYL